MNAYFCLSSFVLARESRFIGTSFSSNNKMTGSSNETLATLFFNTPSSFHLLLILFNFSSIFVANFFFSIYQKLFPISTTNEDGHEDIFPRESDHLEFFNFDQYTMEKEDLVADIIHGGESLLFIQRTPDNDQIVIDEDIVSEETKSEEEEEEEEDNEDEDEDDVDEYMFQDPVEVFVSTQSPVATSRFCSSDDEASEFEQSEEEDPTEEDATIDKHSRKDGDSLTTATSMDPSENGFNTPIQIDLGYSGPVPNDTASEGEECDQNDVKAEKIETNLSEDGKYFIIETKRIQVKKNVVVDVFGDTCTEGSTSKSSSEWRNSINYRDSGTEDPFSSSSRRSCPTWESYTLYRKYDEEMMFFDRLSAQKLSETESLRAIEACPRSISERIVHKLTTSRNNKKSSQFHRNPYQELETAYVAQICLTWEALNWNYKNFQRVRTSRRDQEDPGCPGQIVQQFQQFQVLLQRFIENEPYEHGRRPEVYARMRNSAPKLLQVPEYKDTEDDHKKEGFNITVSSNKFERVMEDAIRTFMNFLKADKETPCEILTGFFKRNQRKTVDPTYLNLMKKSSKRKKMRIKDIYRARKCLRRRKMKEEDEMEILMSLIDLKVVSRVLRMSEISEEQLQWCEDKLNKVKVWEGKLQRDSTPLFFPAH